MIELWMHDQSAIRNTVIFKNVPCVPRVGEWVELPHFAEVRRVRYDMHPDNGNVRVHLVVDYNGAV